jgi:tetratricopeptide (TPR) repeat protein
MGRRDQALAVYQDALTEARAAEDQALIADLLRSLGMLYRDQGNYVQSTESLQQAAQLWRELEQPAREVSALRLIASNYASVAQYPAAFEAYEQALAIARTTQDQAETLDILTKVADLHDTLGRRDQALALYQEALTAAQEYGDQALVASVFDSIGALYRRQGSYAHSTESLQQAVQLWRELDDAERAARALLAIGENYISQGQNTQAFEHFEQAQALAPADSAVAAQILSEISAVHVDLRQFPQAQEGYLRALAIWRQLEDANNELNARRALWEIYTETGQYAEAEAITNVPVGITTPISGTTVGNLVTMTGLAQHPQFRKWQVDLLIDGDSNQATHVAARTRPQWGNLAQLDTTKYPDGQHVLRLRVVRQDTNYDEYFTTITIRNQ